MSALSSWTVQPVRLGVMRVDMSQLIRGFRGRSEVDIPCIAWILRGSDGVIVVDTGPSDDEWSAQHHNPMVRPRSEGVSEAFHAAGVDVRDVEIVINTHLHWDHCYGNSEFPNANFYVQRAELEYARAPNPCDVPIYESDMTPPFEATIARFKEVDGSVEISKGVSVVPTAGHTPGHQGVLVEGKSQRIFIAGDAVGIYENIEGSARPGTLYTDLTAWYRSIHTMRAIADLVLPGHDSRVFKEAVYT